MLSTCADLLLAHRYQLTDRIATGGFGEVWRGTDVILARPVAVKLLQDGYARHPEALARFRAEARHAGALCHEGIARVYDYGEPEAPHPPFLVMELVDGPSLADVLAGGPLDLVRAVDVIAQAAAGLHAAHLAGLVHRDIKPGNLLLSRGGRVKITDFGIAHAVGSAPLTRTGILVGTPGYLAPERVGGASATCASDLYSLGVVAYECLAGAAPFSGTPLEVALAHRLSPMPPLPPAVPAAVAALVSQLTAKDPAARPGSAGEVASRAGELRDRLRTAGCARARPADTAIPALPPGAAPAAPPPAGGTSTIPLAAAAAGTARPQDGPAGSRSAHPARRGGSARRGRGLHGRDPGAAPATVSARRRRHNARMRLRRAARLPSAAAAAALAAVAALALASVMGAAPQHGAAPLPHTAPRPAAPAPGFAEVNAGALIGQPVGTVRRHLLRLGFAVRVLWRPASQAPAGTVVSVQPGGLLPRGSIVTLVGALRGEGEGAERTAGGPGSHGNAGPGGSHRPHGNGNPHGGSR